MNHHACITRIGIMLAVCYTACLSVAGAQEAPVKVYILSGQSNMVGIGSVDSGGSSWRNLVAEPVVSVYHGPYDASTDYDDLEPIQTYPVENFGDNDGFPGEGVHVLRGFIEVKKTGIYKIRPGYGSSTHNITYIDGKEAYRKEPGQEEPTKNPVKLEGGTKTPFKTIYLNEHGGSAGYFSRLDVPGTLTTVVKRQGKYTYLLDESGDWASRDDVWYKGVVTATADKWLSVGCGASSKQIGPELGFGWEMGDYHEAPVLLLKTSQGNRSLGWDFLPPGSERFEYTDENGTTWVYAGYKDPKSRWEKGTEPEKGGWYAGKQYDDCVNAAKDVLDHFEQNFPMWKGRGYEIAGFVWWQGHKDSGSEVHRQRYEQNLVQLIQQMRQDFEAPEAPFVVATIGFHGWDMPEKYIPIAEAQLAVDGDTGNYPALAGNVNSVETRDFWRTASESPKSQDYHYNRNGETYLQIEEATRHVMQSEKDWHAWWGRHNNITEYLDGKKTKRKPPPVDFSTETVLVATMGKRSTGGYSMAFTDIHQEGDTLIATLHTTSPGPEKMVTMALTAPYAIIAVPKHEGPIRFVEQE